MFAPIRRGGSGRHRIQQAVRHRPGALVFGLLAVAAALTSCPLDRWPLHPWPPPPAATSAAQETHGPAPRCTPAAGRTDADPAAEAHAQGP
ncbi:hypothetical protein [Kitasatospora sp. NPDC050543]|uniref:hypothetical protein n=1 Tax=Kitasatospora sp. NPDC050543 TaxID=3364054 RepID=UPI0037A99B20